MPPLAERLKKRARCGPKPLLHQREETIRCCGLRIIKLLFDVRLIKNPIHSSRMNRDVWVNEPGINSRVSLCGLFKISCSWGATNSIGLRNKHCLVMSFVVLHYNHCIDYHVPKHFPATSINHLSDVSIDLQFMVSLSLL